MHYTIVQKDSLEDCKKACEKNTTCVGVEYSGTRCELWTRLEQIQASIALQGFTCLRFLRPTSECLVFFEGVDGGEGRACRGSSPADNSYTYYSVRNADSMASCEAFCIGVPGCVGVEYSTEIENRCEMWAIPDGIQASIQLPGFDCKRIVRWGAGCSVQGGPVFGELTLPTTPQNKVFSVFTGQTALIVCAVVAAVMLLALLVACLVKKAWPRVSRLPQSDIETQQLVN
mmetsp:Transcript_11038/g.19245  ORF Transcript_11038/g.19245 Transcript_11038/m.19245 type:complete len:230 (+) Transcript_11038:106-795(+)